MFAQACRRPCWQVLRCDKFNPPRHSQQECRPVHEKHVCCQSHPLVGLYQLARHCHIICNHWRRLPSYRLPSHARQVWAEYGFRVSNIGRGDGTVRNQIVAHHPLVVCLAGVAHHRLGTACLLRLQHLSLRVPLVVSSHRLHQAGSLVPIGVSSFVPHK